MISIIEAMELYRNEHNLVQEEMAKLIDVSGGHYSDLIRGKGGKNISLRIAANLYKLGIPAEILLQEVPKTKRGKGAKT
jgi:transcriptional regulator with XRE-family HTH domain